MHNLYLCYVKSDTPAICEEKLKKTIELLIDIWLHIEIIDNDCTVSSNYVNALASATAAFVKYFDINDLLLLLSLIKKYLDNSKDNIPFKVNSALILSSSLQSQCKESPELTILLEIISNIYKHLFCDKSSLVQEIGKEAFLKFCKSSDYKSLVSNNIAKSNNDIRITISSYIRHNPCPLSDGINTNDYFKLQLETIKSPKESIPLYKIQKLKSFSNKKNIEIEDFFSLDDIPDVNSNSSIKRKRETNDSFDPDKIVILKDYLEKSNFVLKELISNGADFSDEQKMIISENLISLNKNWENVS